MCETPTERIHRHWHQVVRQGTIEWDLKSGWKEPQAQASQETLVECGDGTGHQILHSLKIK